MIVDVVEAGLAATNGYLVADHENGVGCVIDAPEGITAALQRRARERGVTIRLLLNTHGHWDHIVDNAELKRQTGAAFGIHRESEPLLRIPQTQLFGLDLEIEAVTPDFYLEPSVPVVVGDLTFEVLECPGHCPGSVALYERTQGVLFAGDALFAGSIGRTDLPGGDHALLLRSIRDAFMTLPDEVRVLSGHGPETTIGRERRSNPFLV